MAIDTTTDGIDPRLNCAAEICCQRQSAESNKALCDILADLGVPADLQDTVAANMRTRGIVLMPTQLAHIIKRIAFG